MAIDDDTLARIRTALAETDRVDAARIEVTAEQEAVLLRGAVANPEEASVAAMIAEQDVAAVRNELQVDPGLREGAVAAAHPDVSAADQPPFDPDPTGPTEQTDSDQPTEVAESLAENLPWDPPDEPSLAPTQSEERGVLARDAHDTPIAEEGPVPDPDDVEPSAADLSAAELRESARSRARPHDDEDR